MASTAPPSIKSLLQTEHSALQKIFAKVQLLKQLNEIFYEHVDERFRKYCSVANLNFDKLVILAQNAAIATQLRFIVPELLPSLQKHPLLKHIKVIDCKVG
ncbi:MAG TPA: DciA family protein [Gammaproteobacteria bacterium]|nr:DciA family protein [Gammaproteobacteria bacterium]